MKIEMIEGVHETATGGLEYPKALIGGVAIAEKIKSSNLEPRMQTVMLAQALVIQLGDFLKPENRKEILTVEAIAPLIAQAIEEYYRMTSGETVGNA